MTTEIRKCRTGHEYHSCCAAWEATQDHEAHQGSDEKNTIEFIKSFGLSEEKARHLSAGFDILVEAGYPKHKVESILSGALRDDINPELLAKEFQKMAYKR